MLPKVHRLTKPQVSLKSPFKSFVTPYFSIKVRNNDQGYHRYAFVISKKIDKRAVVRNGLKRRMAAVVATHPLAVQGYDYIFYMKKGALEKTVKELEAEILSLRV